MNEYQKGMEDRGGVASIFYNSIDLFPFLFRIISMKLRPLRLVFKVQIRLEYALLQAQYTQSALVGTYTPIDHVVTPGIQ